MTSGSATGSQFGFPRSGFGQSTTPTTSSSTSTPTRSFAFGSGSAFGSRASAIKDDMKVGDIKFDDGGEGQRQLVFIHRVQQEYETRCAKPIEGEEAFDHRLAHLDRDMRRALEQTLVGVSTEHDRYRSDLSEFRERLDAAEDDFKRSESPSRSEVCPFLQRYSAQLRKRNAVLRDSLDAVDPPKQSGASARPQAFDYAPLIRTLREQSESILCVSARIAELDVRSQKLRTRFQAMNDGRPFADVGGGDASQIAQTTRAYREFRDERVRDLKKRHTDREKFKEPPPQKSAFGGFGTGTFGRTAASTTPAFGSALKRT